METVYNELLRQQNVRSNLSTLRQRLKDGGDVLELKKLVEGQEALFLGFLDSEDPKTRKNAALLLGDLCYERAADVLYTHYQMEDTLFVRSAYLQALEKMDIAGLLPELRNKLKELQQQPLTEETRKHVEEEIRMLHRIVIRYDGITHHTFDVHQKGCRVLLVTNRNHREVARRMAGNARLHPLGVWVETDDLLPLLLLRTYREMLFPMEEKKTVSADAGEAAEVIAPWMLEMCRRYHKEDGAFYFRIECRGSLPMDKRSSFTKKLAACLERLTDGGLVNAPADYEVELRLYENTQGRYFPCLRFATLPDHRFDYRKNTIPASIHPSAAALMMELAKPYLKEGAQIIDPFCGVGTMLIERDIAVPAGDKYGTDIFGDAIILGRENASLAREAVNFIHRDFFDFRHSYRFDEIITNMPYLGKKTREEKDDFYEHFFDQAQTILKDGAVMILYTNETGIVKKQIRLHPKYRLLQETCMQERTGFYLLVVEVEG